MKKETLRTDKEPADLVLGDDDLVYEAVRADFARELERELAAKSAEVERLRKKLQQIADGEFYNEDGAMLVARGALEAK